MSPEEGLQGLYDETLVGNAPRVQELTEEGLALGMEPQTLLFDALGASATKKPAGLDRHWRNARTLASHNPRIYKHRIIGDFAVNGTPPPYQWRIGASAG